jgi:uncharacterized protein DUF3560
MDTLTLRHTAASGTVLLNTTKGDGAADVLRGAGFRWRWSRNIDLCGAWYVPHTRDRAPNLGPIERYAEVLRAAGFTVNVDVDATPRLMDAAEAERAERMEARSDRLDKRASTKLAKAEAHYEAANKLTENMPFDQPILVDHYSAGPALARQNRVHRHMDKSCELRAQSRAAREAADTASGHMRFRHNPLVVVRRIERLKAERRAVQRNLDGYTRNSLTAEGRLCTATPFHLLAGSIGYSSTRKRHT